MFLFNKIKFLFINRNNKNKVRYLRKAGATIGEGTRLLCGVSSFGTEPYLISVGKDCLLTGGISIVTHDGGVSVLNNLNMFNEIKMDKVAPVEIGNNVFIGAKTIIMPGVKIGNNVIIGAGSIVARNIPDNSVAAGVPAKVLKSVDEYYADAMEKGLFFESIGMGYEEKKKYLLNEIKKRACK